MLAITSIGRAGSSLMAKFFQELGYDIGKVRWIDGIDAGGEDQISGNINLRIIRGTLDREGRRKISTMQTEIIKDPQFLVDPECIRVWSQERKDLSVLYLKRDPDSIIASLKRHPKMNSPVFRNHADLIIEHENEFLKTCEEIGLPLIIMEFPFTHKSIYELWKWINPEEGFQFWMEIWNDIFDESKVHIK